LRVVGPQHHLTCVETNKTASRTDEFDRVKQIDSGTTANVEDCRSRRQSDTLQHEPPARLDRWELLCLIHEPNKEVRILGAVDLCEKVGMGMGAHGRFHSCSSSARVWISASVPDKNNGILRCFSSGE
jgi:hypothetical protein